MITYRKLNQADIPWLKKLTWTFRQEELEAKKAKRLLQNQMIRIYIPSLPPKKKNER